MFWNATRCPGLSSLSFLYLEQGTQVSGKEGTGNFSTVAVDRDLICPLGRGWGDRDGPSPALFPTPTACILSIPSSPAAARFFSRISLQQCLLSCHLTN